MLSLVLVAKGQLISKCLFGVLNFLLKTKKTSLIVVKLNSFVRSLEEMLTWKNHFDFVWPLVSRITNFSDLLFFFFNFCWPLSSSKGCLGPCELCFRVFVPLNLNNIFTDLEPKKLINIWQKWAIPATVHWPDSG